MRTAAGFGGSMSAAVGRKKVAMDGCGRNNNVAVLATPANMGRNGRITKRRMVVYQQSLGDRIGPMVNNEKNGARDVLLLGPRLALGALLSAGDTIASMYASLCCVLFWFVCFFWMRCIPTGSVLGG